SNHPLTSRHLNWPRSCQYRRQKMRKTKIVCTIGPASESPETLKEMVLAGMN
ncbi:MAG TPA: hypothetical protein DG577_00975, partial [Firmicutes bacterium]|nr:hypothetical protein [Bacillota bacterium]